MRSPSAKPCTPAAPSAAGPRELLYVATTPDARAPRPALEALRAAGWRVHRVTSPEGARALLVRRPVRVGLLHLPRFDLGLAQSVQAVVEAAPGTAWVALLDRRMLGMEPCRRLIRRACFDFHTLPVDARRLAATVGHAHGMAALHPAAEGTALRGLLVGDSEAIHRLRAWTLEAAERAEPVLVAGEAGVGKARLGYALHMLSRRRAHRLVEVEGAQLARLGEAAPRALERARLEAGGGTLLLRRIERLPEAAQRELVRWLRGEVQVAARLVCTTRVVLRERALEHAFSAELCLLLQGRAVEVPPLRARTADVRPLALHFLELARPVGLAGPLGYTRRAMDALRAHDWPGNVRELEGRVRAAVRAAAGRVIQVEALGLRGPGRLPTLAQARIAAERAAIREALAVAGGNVTRAAHMLGISRASLYRLMARHGIE